MCEKTGFGWQTWWTNMEFTLEGNRKRILVRAIFITTHKYN